MSEGPAKRVPGRMPGVNETAFGCSGPTTWRLFEEESDMKIKLEKPSPVSRQCVMEHADPGVCGGPNWALVIPMREDARGVSTTSICLCLNHCAQLKDAMPMGTEAPR